MLFIALANSLFISILNSFFVFTPSPNVFNWESLSYSLNTSGSLSPVVLFIVITPLLSLQLSGLVPVISSPDVVLKLYSFPHFFPFLSVPYILLASGTGTHTYWFLVFLASSTFASVTASSPSYITYPVSISFSSFSPLTLLPTYPFGTGTLSPLASISTCMYSFGSMFIILSSAFFTSSLPFSYSFVFSCFSFCSLFSVFSFSPVCTVSLFFSLLRSCFVFSLLSIAFIIKYIINVNITINTNIINTIFILLLPCCLGSTPPIFLLPQRFCCFSFPFFYPP